MRCDDRLGCRLDGAGITYLINVRQRRTTYIEDLINAAIATVAAAEVSVDYLAAVGRPTYMSDEDFKQYQSWLVMEGMKAWATKVAQANEALARVLPYRPEIADLLPFSPDATHRGTHTRIISALRKDGPPVPSATVRARAPRPSAVGLMTRVRGEVQRCRGTGRGRRDGPRRAAP